MNKIDIYVLAVAASTSWLLWRIVDVVTLGPVFKILGQNNFLGYFTIIILAFSMYSIFYLLSLCINHVQNLLTENENTDTAKKLSKSLPHLLFITAIYIALLVGQALWYMIKGY